MRNIYVLEHFNFSTEQMKRLKSLGNVVYYDKANQNQIDAAVASGDPILLDWIDPTNILLNMKKGQFICLPYTGFDWITSLKQAVDNGVVISNTPNYSTNAVAEHHLGLILTATKQIPYFNKFLLNDKKVPFKRSMEVAGKTIGIIGLGHIGSRLAELLKPFRVNIITYNPHKKNLKGIKDVSLEELLKQSNIVCVTCRLADSTGNMLNKEKLSLMKDNAVLTQTTGGIIDLNDLYELVKENKFFGIGLDDIDQVDCPKELLKNDRVYCSYHRAFYTNESEKNRIDICIDNIEAYLKGKPINLIKL